MKRLFLRSSGGVRFSIAALGATEDTKTLIVDEARIECAVDVPPDMLAWLVAVAHQVEDHIFFYTDVDVNLLLFRQKLCPLDVPWFRQIERIGSHIYESVDHLSIIKISIPET